MSTPAVSVVMPTHNRAHLIGRALRSVLAQSFSDLEVLVMDDASTDNTDEVVRAIGDVRVRHIRSDSRLGPAAQRNLGIKHARAEYVAFQDSDDEWFLEKLEKQVERMRALPPDVALTHCALIRHQESGYVQQLWNPLTQGREKTEILRTNTNTFTQTWLARRDALVASGGFDERLRLWDDWEFLIRICQKYRVDNDARFLCLVYDTPGSLVKQNDIRLSGMELLIEKHRALMEQDPKVMARNLYVLGRFHLIDGRASSGYRLMVQSLRRDPKNPRAWLLLALALPGAWFLRSVLTLLDRIRYSRPRPST
jgi:glycosyltransferase involved in cell wall biosynthesis